MPLVADAERLPFSDRSVDVVYVHDGLHHLADPLVGLAEMARVAARAVSVTEPARAAVTRLAIRAGIAGEFEDAGNRVERVTVDELRAELHRRGFDVVHAERYGMFYRHAPKRPMRFFSRRGLLRVSQAAFLIGNRLAGGLGNKLAVQAVRAEVAR
jgi:SAM-dependent methyltransferase